MATGFSRSSTLDGTATKHRTPRISMAAIRELFLGSAPEADPDDRGEEPWMAFARQAERGPAEDVLPRFPVVRQGYARPAVDQYILELEHELGQADVELADLRGRTQPADEVNRELKRLGEQTSAVLIAAHEQRDEIVRAAKEEAERLVSEAAAEASRLATESQAQLRALEAQNEATRRERDRLFDDIRTVSGALGALVGPTGPEQVAPQA